MEGAAPRDNVVFEAGYFLSTKGAERCLIVRHGEAKMRGDVARRRTRSCVASAVRCARPLAYARPARYTGLAGAIVVAVLKSFSAASSWAVATCVMPSAQCAAATPACDPIVAFSCSIASG